MLLSWTAPLPLPLPLPQWLNLWSRFSFSFSNSFLLYLTITQISFPFSNSFLLYLTIPPIRLQADRQTKAMGPVRIRYSSHDLGWQSSHSVDLAGWQAKLKWLPLKFGYHDVMRTSPIVTTQSVTTMSQYGVRTMQRQTTVVKLAVLPTNIQTRFLSFFFLIRPCKFFSVFLVRVRHETLCGRAEKTNKAPEINTASFYLIPAAWSVKALKRGSLSEKLFWKKKRFVLLGKVAASLWEASCERRTGRSRWTTRRPSETFAHFSSFQFSSTVEDCRTKHGTEDLLKMCVLSGERTDNSSSKLTKAVCYYYLTFVISHNAKRFLIQRFAFGVTPCYLLQSRLSKEDRSN